MKLIRINPEDNVAVALEDIKKDEVFNVGSSLTDIVNALDDVPRGHKIALCDIAAGTTVIKYGSPIAVATCDIKKGEWVHTHNVRTELSENTEYRYDHRSSDMPEVKSHSFMGYRRADGQVGIRNEIWIIPIVGCVNDVARELARSNQDLVSESGGHIDGLYSFAHPYGCSQLGDDLATTAKLLTSLVHHPNAGGVLCLSLGCENLP
ncbi:MAG: altronate dehydratase, partial [Clostridiales bacterium]|nr:altronate dehydratase [Clostridiales bacterium]